MARPPVDFGKRKPATPRVTSPPVKRSHHVALLMMGTMAVGGGAYTLMPRQNCEPSGPGMAAPSSPEAAAACAARSSSSGGGHNAWRSGSSFYGGSSTSSGMSTTSGSSETTRGGFGSFGHLFSGGS